MVFMEYVARHQWLRRGRPDRRLHVQRLGNAILLDEETEDAAENPGRAVIVSVLVLAFLYSFFTFAYQGAVTPGQLQAG
jgi:hypothetical protein